MATVDTTPDLIADLGEEVKSRSANAAAAKLENFGGAAIAAGRRGGGGSEVGEGAGWR